MYAEPGYLLPYFHSFSSEIHSFSYEIQQIQEICQIHNHTIAPSTLVHSTIVSEYDLCSEGDLFKAPEPIIISEPSDALPPLDPVTISLISGASADDVLAGQALDPTGPLMTEAFYDVKNDLIQKSAINDDTFQFTAAPATEIPVLDVADAFPEEPKIPVVLEAEEEDPDIGLQKSVSSGCLTSSEWINSAGAPLQPTFLDFQRLNLEDAFGIRRAFSEGDIQTLGNVKASRVYAPSERSLTIGNYSIEERKQKLHRYRNKKTKRNFNRKIKYACRKALADSQPRVRGRFAKTEDSELSKASMSALAKST